MEDKDIIYIDVKPPPHLIKEIVIDNKAGPSSIFPKKAKLTKGQKRRARNPALLTANQNPRYCPPYWKRKAWKEIKKVGIQLGIVPVQYPTVGLSESDSECIKKWLLAKIDRTTNGPSPRFSECLYRGSVLLITCADVCTKKWLRQAIKDEKPMEIMLINSKSIGTMIKVNVWIPGPKEEPAIILKRFQLQNSFSTAAWRIVNAKEDLDGIYYDIVIDKSSWTKVQAIKCRPHFQLARVTFQAVENSPLANNLQNLPFATHLQNPPAMRSRSYDDNQEVCIYPRNTSNYPDSQHHHDAWHNDERQEVGSELDCRGPPEKRSRSQEPYNEEFRYFHHQNQFQQTSCRSEDRDFYDRYNQIREDLENNDSPSEDERMDYRNNTQIAPHINAQTEELRRREDTFINLRINAQLSKPQLNGTNFYPSAQNLAEWRRHDEMIKLRMNSRNAPLHIAHSYSYNNVQNRRGLSSTTNTFYTEEISQQSRSWNNVERNTYTEQFN